MAKGVKKMKKFFRTYWPFSLNELKSQLAYRGAFYLFILTSLFGSFISYFLWMAIYGSAEGTTLGNLSWNEMVVYIFMVYVTTSIVSISISDWIGDDVVDGIVAMNLIKPIDYRMSLIFRALGNSIHRFISPAVFVWIGLELVKIFYFNMEVTPFSRILAYIVSCIMSFMIFLLFDFCFGMISFYTTYIFGLQMAKDALMGFLTGQLIPLTFFPEAVRQFLEFLPFSSMIYTPVMVYLGKYSNTELLFELGKQGFWMIFLYVMGTIIWKQITKRLVVLGG